jgi:hypothetical protein
MNGVLTDKELRTHLKNKKDRAEELPKEVSVESPIQGTPSASPEVSNEDHFLFHPDNPKHSSGYKEGSFLVTVEGRSLALSISGGVIRTNNVLAKNELIRQGFVFMCTRPIGVDNE